MNSQMFARYASAIRNQSGNALDGSLLLASAGRLSVHYAPFDWVNHDIGLHAYLGLATCRELFDSSVGLLQSCSVLPFPVFVDGADYNGTPDPLRDPLLREQIDKHFAPMVRALARAVFVPLGTVPAKVLVAPSTSGVVARERILEGLPHPSGANAERIHYFLGQQARERLSVKTDPIRLDAARVALTRQVAALAGLA